MHGNVARMPTILRPAPPAPPKAPKFRDEWFDGQIRLFDIREDASWAKSSEQFARALRKEGHARGRRITAQIVDGFQVKAWAR